MNLKQEYLRKLPKVDVLLKDGKIQEFCEEYGREFVVEAIREELDELRLLILRECQEVQENAGKNKTESAEEADKEIEKETEKEAEKETEKEAEKETDRKENRTENRASDKVSGKKNTESRIQYALDHFTEHLEKRLHHLNEYSLRKVLNATGIILHTNLGRAPLGKIHLDAMTQAMCGYSNLEFDLEKGQRGKRWTHYADLISKVTGAEHAIAVNNNAASLTLIFGALTKGKEVIVSRGESIEIGGKFRIPEVVEQSGAVLREVGTTNRTRIADYEKAITEQTGALLKVHTSNYKVVGFTEEASLEELAELGRKYNLPVIMDLGSGVLVDLEKYDLAHEPTVQEMLKKGADLVCFSGDKLLGGPQAGIIIGKKSLIQELEHYPLMRAIRLDKCLIAALEATFREYLDEDRAVKNIPVLRMIARTEEELEEQAADVLKMLKTKAESENPGDSKAEEVSENAGDSKAEEVSENAGDSKAEEVSENSGDSKPEEVLENSGDSKLEEVSEDMSGTFIWDQGMVTLRFRIEPSISMVGGGSLPGEEMKSRAITIEPEGVSCDVLNKKMRELEIPVIAHTKNDKIWMDMRTVLPEEVELLVQEISKI